MAKFLGDSEFKWNGDYDVERFDGENKQLLEEAIAYYSSPRVAAAAGPR